ncbi:MAG TPA: cytochrome c4 [Albitalea sp.]
MRVATLVAIVASILGAAAAWAQGAAVAQTGPTAGVEDTMAQRMQACVICHGKEGRATREGYFPRIAGKPAGYLYNQLHNFKAGRRQNDAMSHLLQHLSDDYLRDIANHFAELDLPYPPMRPSGLTPQQQRLAEKLVFEGVPERELPACADCHGRQMAGRLPAMPGLLTLPADYLNAQLGRWRNGQRKAMDPDCMAEIAKRLTPEEVSAVSRWLSAQTIDAGTKPAPALGAALPMPCGGVER